MRDLHRYQRLLAEALDNIDTPAPARLIAACRQHGIGGSKGIEVYRANVIGARMGSLEKGYPVCLAILGARPFAAYARTYISAHPSHSHDLETYGEAFCTTLEQHTASGNALADYPYLPDLARFEYACRRALLAPDPGQFDFEAFSTLVAQQGASRIALLANPTLQLMQTPWPVDALWQSHRENRTETLQASGEKLSLVVHRTENGIEHARINSQMYPVLDAIRAGASMPELDELGRKQHVELSEILPGLLQAGWICGSRLHED